MAAVILHLNDTYQIEERPPDIPGMARIAEAVRLIAAWVEASTGEDRTLVVHSGDFLSPSFMTTRLGFAGKQMVELLNHCGVDYATVGNHEFDVSRDELQQRFLEADFGLVNANLTPPRDFIDVKPLLFWPEREPFLAITGLSGRQTIGKAVRPPYYWSVSDWQAAVEAQLAEVRARPEIGALALLTHMDRDEDKELQDPLNEKWHEGALAFILGGHDHDIDWQEPGGRCVLCKNLSNAGTMTAIVLSKSAIAAPARWPGPSRPYPSREEARHLMQNGYPLHCPLGTWYACLVDTTRHPVAGLDYPRTFQAMDERFRDDAACREYIRRLRWPQEFTCPPLRRGGGAMGDGRGMAAVSGLPQTDIADRRDDLRGYP